MLSKFLARIAKGAKSARRAANSVFNRRQSSDPEGNSGLGKAGPEKETVEMINGVPMPPEPTYCCNSGCPNCVWIKYAQEVTQLFDNGDVIAKNKILEKVQDPKLRAYLFTQLGLEERQTS